MGKTFLALLIEGGPWKRMILVSPSALSSLSSPADRLLLHGDGRAGGCWGGGGVQKSLGRKAKERGVEIER